MTSKLAFLLATALAAAETAGYFPPPDDAGG